MRTLNLSLNPPLTNGQDLLQWEAGGGRWEAEGEFRISLGHDALMEDGGRSQVRPAAHTAHTGVRSASQTLFFYFSSISFYFKRKGCSWLAPRFSLFSPTQTDQKKKQTCERIVRVSLDTGVIGTGVMATPPPPLSLSNKAHIHAHTQSAAPPTRCIT